MSEGQFNLERMVIRALKRDDMLLDFTGLTEDEILEALAQKVQWLLKNDQEQLIRIAYRLDLRENQFNAAVSEKDAAVQIARLIFKRQWEKAVSRMTNRTNNDDGIDYDLKW